MMQRPSVQTSWPSDESGRESSSTVAAEHSHVPIGEQLMQVDQAITLTLQEIDANFARTHQTITSRILPAVKRYGIASHNTWQGAKFWHRFFETASDIHLAPPRGETTFDSQQSGTELVDESGEEELGLDRRQDVSAAERRDDEEASMAYARPAPRGLDESGELDESEFEPPRLSDASVAASSRLESGNDLRKTSENVEDEQQNLLIDDLAQSPTASVRPSTLKSAGLATNLLRARHEQMAKNASAQPKVHATPRRGGNVRNPFTSKPVNGEGSDAAAARSQKQNAATSPRWNGIADLRKTPLKRVSNKQEQRKRGDQQQAKGKGSNLAYDGDEDEDSLAWPAGMSPPVTMQFSVPRSRYNKTPAKEAARMVVDDLLRTVEGSTPAARRRMVQEREQRSKQSVAPDSVGGKSTQRPTKGRQSIPTPPTITKRIGGGAKHSKQTESTPNLSAERSAVRTAGNASSSSAARLLDEDEEGQSVLGDGDGRHDGSLRAGISQLSVDERPRGAGGSGRDEEDDDDDDSDNDAEDDSDEDEDEDLLPVGGSLPSLAGGRRKTTLAHALGHDQFTGPLTTSSVSHSIDEDTLFGIRDPSLHKAKSVSTKAQGTVNGVPSRDDAAHAIRSDATPSSRAFRPFGHVQSMGTVHRGRPLLDEERDHTYSAPSPTPAAVQRRGAN